MIDVLIQENYDTYSGGYIEQSLTKKYLFIGMMLARFAERATHSRKERLDMR